MFRGGFPIGIIALKKEVLKKLKKNKKKIFFGGTFLVIQLVPIYLIE